MRKASFTCIARLVPRHAQLAAFVAGGDKHPPGQAEGFAPQAFLVNVFAPAAIDLLRSDEPEASLQPLPDEGGLEPGVLDKRLRIFAAELFLEPPCALRGGAQTFGHHPLLAGAAALPALPFVGESGGMGGARIGIGFVEDLRPTCRVVCADPAHHTDGSASSGPRQ